MRVSLSAASGFATSTNYAVTGGTATGGGVDYTLASGTANIAAGDTYVDIPFTIVDDDVDELPESIVVTLSNPVHCSGGGTFTYNILDNDAAPTVSLSVNNSSVSETGGTATLTATLSNPTYSGVTIGLSRNSSSTAASGDFSFGTSIAISSESLTGTASFSATSDLSDESDENAVITITSWSANVSGASSPSTTITILDDDNTITISTAGTGAGATSPSSSVVVTTGAGTTITATPAASSNFTSWSGCNSAADNSTCTLNNITSNKSVTATFTLKRFTVTVATAGTGTGSAGQTTQEVNYGSDLSATAAPDASSDFVSWSGCIVSLKKKLIN